MDTHPIILTTEQIAQRLNGRLDGPCELEMTGINSLDDAEPNQISFITDPAHAKRWGASRAGAVVVSEGVNISEQDTAGRALIYVPDAELALIKMLTMWAPPIAQPETGIHKTAWVHPSAQLGENVRIGSHVSVERDVVIGDGVTLHAGVRLYPQVILGDGCMIHSNCVIRERCTLGRGVILHPGATVGSDGFGYRPAPDGSGLLKVPQIGIVEIGDDVEIGSNTAIDRAKFGVTRIGAGTKIDNLCHIGHNCVIGRSCVIAGGCMIAGSVVIGDGVVMGGCVKIADHINIGDGVTLAAATGVGSDIPAGATWAGYWGCSAQESLRQTVAVRKLPDYMKRLTRLLKASEQP